MRSKRKGSKRRQPAAPPARGRAPGQRLSQQDIDGSADELVAYLRLWTDQWPRREQRDWSAFYPCGQLASWQGCTTITVRLPPRPVLPKEQTDETGSQRSMIIPVPCRIAKSWR